MLTMTHLDFDLFRLDQAQRTVLQGDTPLQLSGRAFDVLWALASADGKMVSKGELISQIWPDQIVQENTLHVQISALRKFLQDKVGDDLILTVPGRGYRLTASRASKQTPARAKVIAVLPFRNMSGDPDQGYFVDGMVEDIITGLARVRWFSVVGRNSTFAYRDRQIAPAQAGEELGARYILDGSIRKAGSRIRITAELTDAETGLQLWGERYDRILEDIFALQDELTMNVVGAIEPTIRRAEIDRVRRRRPESLDAYDLVLRAMPYLHSYRATEIDAAKALLKRALKLEPGYPAAHASIALCYHACFSWGGLREEDRIAAVEHAYAGSADITDDASALGICGFVLSLDGKDHVAAGKLFDRALALSRSDMFTLLFSSIAASWLGDGDVAVERANRALKLSPFDPLNYLAFNAIGIAGISGGRYGEAHEAATRSIRINPGFCVSHAIGVAGLMGLGLERDAREAASRLLKLDPQFSIARFATTVGINRDVFGRFANFWRAAGIPES
ncbi:MAG: winged helix-turn-helix domain-containing protein [Rhizobiales bacterium]|nr:winged helix-turn-helix domain-containing protein [Hyphomicrobiales bacterium]